MPKNISCRWVLNGFDWLKLCLTFRVSDENFELLRGFFVIQLRVTRRAKRYDVFDHGTLHQRVKKTNNPAKKDRATMDVFGEKHSKKNTNMWKKRPVSAWLGRDFNPKY